MDPPLLATQSDIEHAHWALLSQSEKREGDERKREKRQRQVRREQKQTKRDKGRERRERE
jgi:hypothetical protein